MAEFVSRGTLEPVLQDATQDSRAEGVLLNVDQVAERLGTPTRFVRRLIAERRIGFCRIGRYVRITDSDVAAFIEAARVPPAVTSLRVSVDAKETDVAG
jgi:excisionase family DNA binding protein